MKLDKAKEIAARILNVGKSKVFVDSKEKDKVKDALTKEDLRSLIKEKIIKKLKPSEQSRSRARVLKEKKKKGRKRGPGKRKGTKKARSEKKSTWVKNIRAQRKVLKKLKEEGKIDKSKYRKAYKLAKGGNFKGKKQLIAFIEEK